MDSANTVREILASSSLRVVYQPIVDLGSGAVVAYEALARGPKDSPLERPDRLFAAARESGQLADLDWACRAAAIEGALDAGLSPPLALFINVEPTTLGSAVPERFGSVFLKAAEDLRLVVEITERALTSRPADLLGTIERFRALGWGVALDDVGADPDSLALMPFLHPDVIKLDLRLVQNRPDVEIAEVVNAVIAQAELTEATVLAEGIETEEHREKALAMGATLGQGWLFGKPAPLSSTPMASEYGVRLLDVRNMPRAASPFEHLRALRPSRRGRKRLLLALSQHLENEAITLPKPPVVLATFQEAERFGPNLARRYADLATRSAFVGVLGVGMGETPALGVRGAALAHDDPLRGQWNVLVVGPHFAGALSAKDLGDTGPDADRRFDFILTYDRPLVIQAAQFLMRKVAPIL